MNPGKIPKVMILVGTNDICRGSDEQEALWESMMVCLFYDPLAEIQLRGTDRLHCANEYEKPDSNQEEGTTMEFIRWNNILRNLCKSKCRKNDPHGHRT